MKEELIKLATSKKFGFSSKFLYQEAYKYSTKEDLRYLFWLTELQKWLREVHNIHIWVTPLSVTNYEYYYFKGTGYTFSKYDNYTTYELALEEGLYQALLSI